MAADPREQLAEQIERLQRRPSFYHGRDDDDLLKLVRNNAPALVQALRDAARAERLTWQPIETAPRDGTQILIARINDNVGCNQFELTEWCVSDYYQYEHVEGDLYRRVSNKREFWNNNGHRATHWMPLPEPPTALDPTP